MSLIGRRSEKRAILPEVSLDLDDGIPHRHALLTRGDDGSLTLRDIGSANGTRLNGADVQPLADTVLHDGDEITLGPMDPAYRESCVSMATPALNKTISAMSSLAEPQHAADSLGLPVMLFGPWIFCC